MAAELGHAWRVHRTAIRKNINADTNKDTT